MTGWRSEEGLVGAVALVMVPVLAWRIARGLRDGSIPLYRTRLRREDDRVKFTLLVLVNVALMLAMAAIGLDLLFNLRLWELP